MKVITSRNNERIKDIVRLRDRKSRTESGRFFIEGIHLAEEYIRNCGFPLEVYFTEKAYNSYRDFFASLPDDILYSVSDSVFEKISTEASPQGVLCICKSDLFEQTLPERGSFLFLESVRDAGNLGTIIRTAVSLGAFGIVLSPDCADIYNPKTLRASMGAVFAADIFVPADFKKAVIKAKEYGKVYATTLYDNSLELGKFEVCKNDSFIIGNEGQGITEEIRSLADNTVIIPMTGKTESLNAAAAAAIIIWEMTRSYNGR
ncbi:MAG: RNA methyltransferase [Ruminococcaceae bacterium]|nr:RNA methyltransferase [Oscillospiraceae bacterium]